MSLFFVLSDWLRSGRRQQCSAFSSQHLRTRDKRCWTHWAAWVWTTSPWRLQFLGAKFQDIRCEHLRLFVWCWWYSWLLHDCDSCVWKCNIYCRLHFLTVKFYVASKTSKAPTSIGSLSHTLCESKNSMCVSRGVDGLLGSLVSGLGGQ